MNKTTFLILGTAFVALVADAEPRQDLAFIVRPERHSTSDFLSRPVRSAIRLMRRTTSASSPRGMSPWPQPGVSEAETSTPAR